MTIDDLRNEYLGLYTFEPTTVDELARVEEQLGLLFPQDFREISRFYNGGIIGGISHNAIATGGPANNITEETKRLRIAVKLPLSLVVLAEPPASLIVMDTNPTSGSAVVIWCDATDVSRLGLLQGLHNPQTWPSYAEFFRYLLDTEREERDG